jgi:hypothetical protein
MLLYQNNHKGNLMLHLQFFSSSFFTGENDASSSFWSISEDELKLHGLSPLPLSPALLSSPETERGGFSCNSNRWGTFSYAIEVTLGDSAFCEANCFTTTASSSAAEEALGNVSNLNDCWSTPI